MILKHSRIFSLIIILLSAQLSWAVDASYYSSLNSKSGTTLFSAVTTVCGTGWGTGTGTISYKGLWTTYQTTDANSDGSLIADVYSTCEFTTTAAVLAKNNDGVGGYCSGISYSTYCDCYNREHTVPQSWWGGGETVPYGVDVVHVLPTDGKVNSQRSSHPLGECSSGTVYGSISKLGTSTFSTGPYNANGKSYTVSHVYDGSDQVWEPADDYKGDFARIYFYMAAKYSPTLDMTTGEGANMFLYNSGYGLTDYSVDLLLKWHRQDPVSLREINRNDKIQETQGNRNPFVDYPDLAEYIWGENAGSSFSTSSATATFTTDYKSTAKTGIYGQDTNTPTITVSNTTLTLDPAPQYGSSSTTFTVVGSNLTGAISLALGGTNSGMFSISSTSIAKANANSSNSITVTYNPTALGSHYATITLTSTSAPNVVINLSGTCAVVRTVTWYDDEGQYEQNTVATGFAPSLPALNPEDCSESRVFVGWTTSGGYTGESAPDGMFTDEAPTVNTDAEFYAVYADKETSGGGSPVVSTAFSTTSLGSTNSVTAGYTVSATASAKTGYYQDGSGTSGVTIYNTTTPMFTSTPSAISLTVSIGAGSDGLDFANYVYATLVNGSGTAVGTAVEITNHVTTSTGDSYTVSIPTTGVTSANGIYLYHTKESGRNIRYYSASLSITTGGGTTTYSNYSTQCTACTPVAATASYAYPTRTTTCGGSVSNTFTTNSNATVSYTSSNTSVATVASDGTVTPVGQGSATITATVPANTCFTGGASASFTLTVNRNTGTASFSGATTTVNKDALVTNLVTTNSDGAVTYSSSNTSVATVNASGVVTGVSAGTAIITANVAQSTCYTAASANYTITVYDFKANAATDVTCESFTANWNTSGAASYSLDVYQGTTSSTTVSRDTTWLNESFASSSQGEFTIDNKSMDSHLSYVWATTASYGMKGSANISGTAYAAESWLISPVLDLTNATSAKLTFDHTTYAASSTDDLDYLLVYVSSDGGSHWTNLTIPTWPSKRWTFVSSGEIDLTTYASSNVKIAFCYKSTSTYAGTWEVKNVVLTGKYDKTISTSSVEHVSGYPKNVSGTSASVTGLDASTTYKYTVTPQGGSASNEIEVTTPACSCKATLTVQSPDDTMGTVTIE